MGEVYNWMKNYNSQYSLPSHNCQHFAEDLKNYLTKKPLTEHEERMEYLAVRYAQDVMQEVRENSLVVDEGGYGITSENGCMPMPRLTSRSPLMFTYCP